MLKWFKARAEARRRSAAATRFAENEALRASIIEEVLGRVRPMISIDLTNELGQPNCNPISLALRNIELSNLNLKFFGYEVAQAVAAAIPYDTATEARVVGLSSKASTQADMESDWVRHWCSQLHVPVILHRKMWEFGFVLQAMFENGQLRAGARGLGFGCGQEPTPSYLASLGIDVTVTDLDEERAIASGWATTGQHAGNLEQSFQAHLVDRAAFDRHVGLEIVDMNAIPDHLRDYDFCWSICALEHLGTIEKGLAFIENSLATLKPGGLSVHTTEFNIDPRGSTIDNWPTVLFQRQHFQELADRLTAQGHYVAPLDFDIGDKPMDRFIDLPPHAYDMAPDLGHWLVSGPHLKVAVDGFASTCFGILVRKAG